ncbi:HK97 gp10 family phage protein, partial [Staphylococcus sp. EG-SA-21]|nr:HK97 gp10 family phage protein [Staphylococcus sp. EG-SA-21]
MAKVIYGSKELVVALEQYEEEMEKWVKKGIAKTTQTIYN